MVPVIVMEGAVTHDITCCWALTGTIDVISRHNPHGHVIISIIHPFYTTELRWCSIWCAVLLLKYQYDIPSYLYYDNYQALPTQLD